jgi:hypothetical protein
MGIARSTHAFQAVAVYSIHDHRVFRVIISRVFARARSFSGWQPERPGNNAFGGLIYRERRRPPNPGAWASYQSCALINSARKAWVQRSG